MEAREALALLAASDREPPARWWLDGPDRFLGEAILRAIADRLGPGTSRRTVEGSQDPAELALWLMNRGFFEEPRFLLWENPDTRSLKRAGMADLAGAAGPGAYAVIWTEKGSAPSAFGDAPAVKLDYLRGAAWTALVQRELRARGLKLTREAESYVAEAARSHGHYLVQALDKLVLAREAGERLDPPLVRQLVPPLTENVLYPLTDALLRRQVKTAWGELRGQLAIGLPPVVAVSVMSRQMLVLDAWLGEGRPGAHLESFLQERGLRPWQARLFREAASLWTAGETASWLGHAANVDSRLKHSSGDAEVWLAGLVLAAGR
jgi:DNA polymerase III delta subunit